MASKFRQDMPPPGGYQPIDWARRFGRKGFSGYAIFGLFAGVSSVGWITYFIAKNRQRREDLEMKDGRIALEPLIMAERSRMYLKQLVKNREDEKELMKDVPGWEAGMINGEPVYHNKDRFPLVHPEEYFAHVSQRDAFDRLLERRKH